MSPGTWRDVAAARRVLIHGVTGSGKSTLAIELGAALGLPVTLVDEHLWLPGWVPVDQAEQDAKAAGWVADECWILDSIYGRHRDAALARADVVIGLDYPRVLSLARLVRRTATGIATKQERCNGNTETLRNVFSRESIVRWHFSSWRRKRESMRAWHLDPSAPPVVLLSRPSDADELVTRLRP